jgi:hypothetical protein
MTSNITTRKSNRTVSWAPLKQQQKKARMTMLDEAVKLYIHAKSAIMGRMYLLQRILKSDKPLAILIGCHAIRFLIITD